jgi:hypothetical protein
LKREIVVVSIVAALILGTGIGYYWNATDTKTTTSTATLTVDHTATQTATGPTITTTLTLITNKSSSSSATRPCGSSGVYCGTVLIAWANLTVSGNESTLEVGVTEVGNMYIGSATVYVNGTVIGTPPASEYAPPGNIMLDIQSNQTGTIHLVIAQSLINIQAGMNYSILVYAWLGPPGERASSGDSAMANVTAQTSLSGNSDDLLCTAATYQVLERVSITVQNGTTQTLSSVTTSTLGEYTYSTTTNTTETVGYATTTGASIPPSTWTVISCTYVK